MPIGKLGVTAPNKNVDVVSLLDSIDTLTDCYFDANNSICKRPGCELFCDLGESIRVDGLFFSETLKKIIAVCNSKVFSIDPLTKIATQLSGPNLLYVNSKVIFAEAVTGSDYVLFMANGGDVAYTSDGLTIQKLTSTGTASIPSNVSHVVYFDTYLILFEVGQSRFMFSNPNLPFKFDIADNYDAESFVDPISGIFALTGKLYIIGTKSVEIFYNSGTSGSPFLRRYGGLNLDSGVYSPGTIVTKDDRLIFVDTRRRVIEMNDGGYKEISKNYNKALQDITSVNEGLAFNLNIAGKEFYVLNFNREDKTYVYDYQNGAWYEWGYWDSTVAEYNRYIGSAACYVPLTNTTLIGSSFDGKLHSVSVNVHSDDGQEIRTRILTSDMSYGNVSTTKNCLGLRVRLKRGTGKDNMPTSIPYFKIRKADNGKNIVDSNFTSVSLGEQGDNKPEMTIWKNSAGRYKTRKYEIVAPDPAPFILVTVEELLRGVNENV